MSVLRIAVVSRAIYPWHGFGGLERHVEAQVRHLLNAGCRVSLFAPPKSHEARRGEPGWSSNERFDYRAIPYRRIPWPPGRGFVIADRLTNYRWWTKRVAEDLAKDDPFDVVHVHGMAGLGIARERGPEVLVLHPHGLEEFKAAGIKWWLYAPQRRAVRTIARHSDQIIIPDASMENEVCRLLRVDRRRGRILPNAVDVPAEREPSETFWDRIHRGLPEQEREDFIKGGEYFLAVGRLEENKGFAVLIDALAKIRDRLGSWSLILVGSGSQSKALRARVHRHGLDARVAFVGALSDDELDECYRRARWFVHPTLYEGSSLVTLEAMARRLPVIGTRVGGIPDKVTNGENGFLIEPGDANELAQALADAIEMSESRRLTWGQRSRDRVDAEFSWSKRTERLIALYEELVRSRSVAQ